MSWVWFALGIVGWALVFLLLIVFPLLVAGHRSGRRIRPLPPGVTPLSWVGAAKLVGANYRRALPVLIGAMACPPLVQTVYGGWRRALALALALTGVAVADSMSSGGGVAFALAFGGLWGLGAVDAIRRWQRSSLDEQVSRSVQRVQAVSAELGSCARCRAAPPAATTGFCDDCSAALAPWAIHVDWPAVRVTNVQSRIDDPTLAPFRADRMAIGAVGGEAVLVPRSRDKAMARLVDRGYATSETRTERAWRDPEHQSWLWTHDRLLATGHSGRRYEVPTLMLHFFDGERLTATWTLAVLAEATGGPVPLAAEVNEA